MNVTLSSPFSQPSNQSRLHYAQLMALSTEIKYVSFKIQSTLLLSNYKVCAKAKEIIPLICNHLF